MLTKSQAILLAPKVAELLFSPKKILRSKTGRIFQVKSMAQNACRGVDIDGIRFVTQNPYKDSPYGKRAQAGAKIIWVIEISTNKWLARVENGEVRVLEA